MRLSSQKPLPTDVNKGLRESRNRAQFVGEPDLISLRAQG